MFGCDPPPRRQVNRKTAQPVPAFVMFASHRGEAGASMRVGGSLQSWPARIVLRQRGSLQRPLDQLPSRIRATCTMR